MQADVPRESAKAILFQFVVFPLGVVAIGVGIFLLFGKLASSEQSIPEYLSEIRSGTSHRKFQAAYELSKSIKRGEARRYPNLVLQVVDVYRRAREDDPRVRQYLALVLGRLGDTRATPALVEGLSDPAVESRIYALLAIAELRDRSATPALMKAARDSEKDVRKTAVYALGQTGDPQAAPLLAEAVNDREADVRFNAALALAAHGDGRAAPALREMLDRSRLDRVSGMRAEQKEEAMVAAIAAYGRLAPAEARRDLPALAERDPDVRVRAAAREALAALR